jgi:hypothetical protein
LPAEREKGASLRLATTPNFYVELFFFSFTSPLRNADTIGQQKSTQHTFFFSPSIPYRLLPTQLASKRSRRKNGYKSSWRGRLGNGKKMARLGRRRKKKVIYIYTLLFSLFFSSSSSFLVVRYTRRDPENFPGTKDGAPLYLSLSLLEKKKKKKKIKVKNFFPFLSFPFWVEKEKRRKRRVLNFGDAQRSSRGFNRFGKRERLARSVSFRFAERESQRKTTKQNATKRFLITFTHTSDDDDDDDAFTRVTWTEQQTKVSPRYRRQSIEIMGVSSQISQKLFKCLLIAIFSLESKRGRNSEQKKGKKTRESLMFFG